MAPGHGEAKLCFFFGVGEGSRWVVACAPWLGGPCLVGLARGEGLLLAVRLVPSAPHWIQRAGGRYGPWWFGEGWGRPALDPVSATVSSSRSNRGAPMLDPAFFLGRTPGPAGVTREVPFRAAVAS